MKMRSFLSLWARSMPAEMEFTLWEEVEGGEKVEVVEERGDRVTMIFVRSFKGRNFGGMESHVFRPIIRAFVFYFPSSSVLHINKMEDRGGKLTPGEARLVTRAK